MHFRLGFIQLLTPLPCLTAVSLLAAEIQLPPETGSFKQDLGAEIANAQCLVCHSVEYVSTQPPFPRAFWKSSVQKMQQKYGATIPEDQVEPLVDYLTRNYGPSTNNTVRTPRPVAEPNISTHADGPQIAAKFGCLGCHNPTIKLVGPAYREIGLKYRDDPQAGGKIDQQIREGGSGKWGPIIMPPFPQVSAKERRLLADWILGMK